jgi:phosphoglycerol transferase MdoB-like AlkP superfamily enzyme
LSIELSILSSDNKSINFVIAFHALLPATIMRQYLLLILKMFLFWWFIFLMNRLVFIIYFFNKFNDVPAVDTAASFLHGFALDVSAISYLMLLPLLLLLLQQFIAILFFRQFLFIYNMLLLILTSFICVYDLAIYTDWGTKLSYRAMQYLEFAGQGAAFTDLPAVLILLAIVLLQVTAGLILLRLVLRPVSLSYRYNPTLRLPLTVFHLLLIGVLVLGIRGGWQQIPINESSAYFSKHQVANDAAVNTFWNAGKKALSTGRYQQDHPYRFFTDEEANGRIAKLFVSEKDTTLRVLTAARPNIVIFLLESFTADVVESFGGEKNVTPFLDSLAHNGLLFSSIYSQGFRTDQGLASVLSGFPAQPNFSVIMSPEKYKSLQFLPEVLASHGYQNSFFYGGETGFANMKAYLLQSGIINITDKSSFDADEMNAKWGAHDGYVFQHQAAAIQKEHEPFFSVVLSLSSHEPFTVPMETKFPGNDVPSKFKNSCAYTDLSLQAYFNSIKNAAWYANTLFILVADHGHLQPRNRNPREPARFHIPVIFFGEVINPVFRGGKIENLGMQTDLPATILSQLEISSEAFTWSNNLLNPYRKNFAYYTSDDAFGWMTDNGTMLFDFKTDSVTHSTLTASEVADGKAYLQKLFNQFISF